MSKMSSMYALLAAYALMGMDGPMSGRGREQLTESERRSLEDLRKRKAMEIKLKGGCREWGIGGIRVVALNRKNAERKALRISSLTEKLVESYKDSEEFCPEVGKGDAC